MGRPRKYVQTNGKEITGVSWASDGRLNITDDNNGRSYFRNVVDASAPFRVHDTIGGCSSELFQSPVTSNLLPEKPVETG